MFYECRFCDERVVGCQTRCPYYKKNKELLELKKALIRNKKKDSNEYRNYKEDHHKRYEKEKK